MDQVSIQFDHCHRWVDSTQLSSQRALTGTDFENVQAVLDGHEPNNVTDDQRILEEILTETFFGSH